MFDINIGRKLLGKTIEIGLYQPGMKKEGCQRQVF